jgi:ABC-type transport system involved in cytochrome bd biosynthesis fused ATPase/permease subunit
MRAPSKPSSCARPMTQDFHQTKQAKSTQDANQLFNEMKKQTKNSKKKQKTVKEQGNDNAKIINRILSISKRT